ncbi:hypothetical protein L1889_18120 [Paenalcaligenes niemegkensis]|uniref:hypothetical protein n=1 Tax=Paenalcaligenes niemegkensis TaxID=2895469 RepID=UPI001EE85B32|nr:hypothetical protein [Paenalcaligenes niemegkensis]MCQ9618356.1 hypothetical protein [Paenalcaligenes niemegkensis]
MTKATRLAALSASSEEMEFWGNLIPKCPHCGDDYDIEGHEAWSLYSEGDHEIECPACDLKYTVSAHATYTYSTDDQPEDL